MSFKKISEDKYNGYNSVIVVCGCLKVDDHEKSLLRNEFIKSEMYFNMGILNDCRLIIKDTKKNILIRICFSKTKDEWFYLSYDYYILTNAGASVQVGKGYYKCDQVYGLIDCVKDVIKNGNPLFNMELLKEKYVRS